jgi:hypothetical protein
MSRVEVRDLGEPGRLTRRQQDGRVLASPWWTPRDGQRSLSDTCERPPPLVAGFRHGRGRGVRERGLGSGLASGSVGKEG